MLNSWDRMIDHVFDDVMRNAFGATTSARAYAPDVDIRTDENRIQFQFDVPGVRQEDLEITVENEVLTVRGTRKFAESKEREQVLLGRQYGSFRLAFRLPDHVDGDKLTAQLTDGVLTIEVPKQEKAKPRRIPVLGGPSNPQLK